MGLAPWILRANWSASCCSDVPAAVAERALKESFMEDYGLDVCGEHLYQPQIFERELDAAGRIDKEIYHCDFESGPYQS